jgi:hypothetical protein
MSAGSTMVWMWMWMWMWMWVLVARASSSGPEYAAWNRAAAREENDLYYLAAGQGREHVVGDVGLGEQGRRCDKDVGHIQRDVVVSYDYHPLAGQVEPALTVIRMAVVPADDRGGGDAAG